MFVPAQHKKLVFLKHRLFLWLVPVVLQAQGKGCIPSAGCLLDGIAACVSSNSNALGLAHMVLQHDGTQAWRITRLGTESVVLLSGDGGHQSRDGRGFAKLLGNQMAKKKKKKMPHHFFLPFLPGKSVSGSSQQVGSSLQVTNLLYSFNLFHMLKYLHV